MMSQPKRTTSFAINAASVLAIAALSAIAPPQYALILFFVFYVALLYVIYRVSMRSAKVPSKAELGTPIYKEANALKVAAADKLLSKDLRGQFVFMFATLTISFLALPLYALYTALAFAPVQLLAKSYTGSDVFARFVGFAGMYAFVMAVLLGVRSLLMRKIKYVGLVIPSTFAVYKRGIVVNEKSMLPITDSICYKANQERRFVELVDISNKMAKVRLYSETPSSLVAKLREIGLAECKA